MPRRTIVLLDNDGQRQAQRLGPPRSSAGWWSRFSHNEAARHDAGEREFRVQVTGPSRIAALLLIALPIGIAGWVTLGRSPSSGPASDYLAPSDLARVAQGKALYAANCASCHGARGEGEPNWKGSNPDGTYPAPPHDATGHTWHHSDKLLLEIIRDGGARFESATFKSRMPAWGDRLSEEERGAVLAYIKTLWGPDERGFQAEASARDPLLDRTR